jgi:hypothetical protein
MSDDIVKRLRLTPVLMYYDVRGYPQTDYEACKRYINDEGVKLMREAADEIERLRKGGCARDQTTTQYCAEAVRLQQERDESRRECCLTWESVMGRNSRDVAADKGWDCFKEVR